MQVDLRHFERLLVLGDDIVQEIRVLLVHPQGLDPHDPFEHDFVALERCREVDEAFLHLHHVEKFLVFQGLVELGLDVRDRFFNLAEVVQIQGCVPVKDLEQKPGLLERCKMPDLSRQEVFEQVGLVLADRYDIFLGDDDPERQRG